MCIHSLKHVIWSPADDVSDHLPGLGCFSIVPADKPAYPRNHVEACQIVWCQTLTLDTEVGVIGEETPRHSDINAGCMGRVFKTLKHSS